jgi:hypothetical protein
LLDPTELFASVDAALFWRPLPAARPAQRTLDLSSSAKKATAYRRADNTNNNQSPAIIGRNNHVKEE